MKDRSLSSQGIMVSQEIENTVDISQFYEKSSQSPEDLTVSFWANGAPITSKLQSMKISGSNLNICFSCNQDQVSRFILASEVHNLIIFGAEESNPILEIKVSESVSRNLKVVPAGDYSCELVVRMFNM
mgnify:CR=1 FL=1|jgi:outer membrane usher protein FimD/PapC|tara:strand:+ start:122 stop:508 length:387 start_codon:yes stop_codon:yes gene_type:complete